MALQVKGLTCQSTCTNPLTPCAVVNRESSYRLSTINPSLPLSLCWRAFILCACVHTGAATNLWGVNFICDVTSASVMDHSFTEIKQMILLKYQTFSLFLW